MTDNPIKQGDILMFFTKGTDKYITIHRDNNWDYLHHGDNFPIATFRVEETNNVFNFEVTQPNGTSVGWISNDIDKGAKFIYASKDVLKNKQGWKIEGNKNGFYLKHTTENKWIQKGTPGYCYGFTDNKDNAAYFEAKNKW